MSTKNKFISFIKNVFKSPLTYILLLSLFIQKIVYSKYQSYSFSGDTLSYLSDMYKDNIFLGKVNLYRTPIYPYFCKFFELFSSKANLYDNIVLGQKVLFFIGIIFFYLTVKKLFNKKTIPIITTLFYALNPYLFLWNTLILTEAVTLFEITLLLYFTVSFIKEPKKSSAIGMGLLQFVLVLTRPANIYLVAAYLLFWILKYFIEKKNTVIKVVKAGLISTLISIIIILLYCNQMRVQHGHFGLTSVSNTNTAITLIYSGLYRYGDNKKIVKDIDEFYVDGDAFTTWDALDNMSKNNKVSDINKFLKNAKKNSGFMYYRYLIYKTFSVGTWNLGTIYSIPIEGYDSYFLTTVASNFFPITFSIVYFFLLGAFIYLLVYLIKKKEIEWMIAALFSIIAGNLFLTIVCAPFEWQRLSVISIPTIIILIPYLITEVFKMSTEKTKKKNNSKKKNNKSSNILKDNLDEFFKYAFKFDMNKLFREATDNTIIQFFRYLFVGGIAAVVNIGMLYVFTDIVHINYIISNVLSFTLGLFTNYILSKKFVFQGETSISKTKEFIIYAIIGVLGLGIDTLLVWLFTDVFKVYYMISKLISTLIVFVWNFGARKVLYKFIK